MSKFTLANVRLFVGAADLTTRNNKIELDPEVEEKDSTAFVPTGDVWKEVLGGLRSTKLSGAGQWEADDTVLGKVDDTAWSNLGGVVPISVCPATASVSSLAWLSGYLDAKYLIGGAVGDVAPWTLDASGNWPLVRGFVAHDPGTARTATGSGTGVQIGPVPAGKSLYAALHVLSVAGTTPSLTVSVQTDTSNTFPAPSTALTFNPSTALDKQILRVAGPITNTWARVNWTISGTTPSFLFLATFGIA